MIDSATGARSQPLILMITTAGTDTSGICYEQRDYTAKGARGGATSTDWFGIIFTIDRDDAWHDRPSGAKANPNLGVSVKTDDMAAAVRKAQAMPSALNNVLTKRLNRWVNADNAWMPIEGLEALRQRRPAARRLQRRRVDRHGHGRSATSPRSRWCSSATTGSSCSHVCT